MKYISIGAVMQEGAESVFDVTRGGRTFRLTGTQAALWLNGRTKFSSVVDRSEQQALAQLRRMGLVMISDETDMGEYRALTGSTIIPAEKAHPYCFLNPQEKRALTWLREAGLVLSMAELVYLIDRDIHPDPNLIGPDNVQNLVECIYTRDTIFDNILEAQMEKAPAMQHTVGLILQLLKKRRIILL